MIAIVISDKKFRVSPTIQEIRGLIAYVLSLNDFAFNYWAVKIIPPEDCSPGENVD